jgi:hypothetical protein
VIVIMTRIRARVRLNTMSDSKSYLESVITFALPCKEPLVWRAILGNN